MKWAQLTGQLANAAPLLGAALGGPAGATVGAMIAQALGTDNDPMAVANALQSDSGTLLELKKLEQSEQTELRRLALESERIRLADRQNAREQHKGHWMPAVLTCALFIAFSALATALFFTVIPEGNRDLVVYLAGQLTGATMTAIAYWLGSSRGSKEKDQQPGGRYG